MTRLFLLLMFASLRAFAQQDSIESIAQPEVSTMIESSAYFYGGQTELDNYIRHNLRYPKKAFEKKIEGEVVVEATIAVDGTVKDPSILNGADLKFGLPEEALRLVNEMPKWKPAYRQRKNGPKQFTAMKVKITIRFDTNNGDKK